MPPLFRVVEFRPMELLSLFGWLDFWWSLCPRWSQWGSYLGRESDIRIT
jgi:hypothetical protein